MEVYHYSNDFLTEGHGYYGIILTWTEAAEHYFDGTSSMPMFYDYLHRTTTSQCATNDAYQLFCVLFWVEIVFVESYYTAIRFGKEINEVMIHASVNPIRTSKRFFIPPERAVHCLN